MLSVAALSPASAVLITLYTNWGRDRLKEAAVEVIAGELGLAAHFDDVEVRMFPRPTVRALGIRLHHPSHGILATASELSIQPSLSAFFRGRLDLQTIRLVSPSVRLLVEDGQVVNLPEIRGDGSTGNSELPFQRLVITDAQVTVTARPFGWASLERADLRLQVSDGNRIDFALGRGQGAVEHAMGREIIRRLSARGRFDPDEGVTLNDFVFSSPYLAADLDSAFVPIPFDDSYRVKGKASVTLSHLERLPHGFDLPPLRGLLSVEGRLAGSADGPKALATIRIQEGEIDVQRRGIGNVELRVQVEDNTASILSGGMEILNDGGYAALRGTIGLRDNFPVDISVDIQNFRFSRFISQLNVSRHTIVEWHLDGPARVRGSLNPLHLQGPIQLASDYFLVTKHPYYDPRQARVIGAAPATIRGRIRVDSEAFRFEGLKANTGRSQFGGDVHLRFNDTILATIQGEVDLADASPLLDFPIGGRGPFRVRVDGRYSDPDVRGHIQINGFSFNDFPLGDAGGDWHLEEGGLAARFPSLSAQKRDSQYRVDDFFLDFTRDRLSITGQLQTPRFALQDFYHIFHFDEDERFTPYQGLIAGNADLTFTHGHPGDTSSGTFLADMRLTVQSANLSGYAFQDGEFQGRWRWKDYTAGYRGGELTVHHAHLKKGDGTLVVQGRMGLGGVLQGTAVADRFRFRDTEGIGDKLPALSGVYNFNADLAGTADSPQVSIDSSLTAVGYGRSMLGDARLYVRLTDRMDPWVRAAEDWDSPPTAAGERCAAARFGFAKGARWPADPPIRTREGLLPSQTRPSAYLICGSGFGGRLAVDVAIGRTLTYPLRGDLLLNGFSLAPFLPTFVEGSPPSGEMTATVHIADGALKARSNLAGTVSLAALRVGSQGVELRNEGPVNVGIRDGTYEIHNAVFVGPSSRVQLSGEASERRGLALNVNGDVDVGLLATLSPRVTQASGSVSVHASVSGPLGSPSVFGQASVRDSTFRYAGFPEPLEELSGVVTFSSRRILLEDFSARIAGGQLSLGGSATVQGLGLERYSLDVEADNVNLRPRPKLEATVSGAARILWNRGDRVPQLNGTLRIRRANYHEDIVLAQTLAELSRGRRAEVEGYNPDQDVLAINLRVIEDAPIRVNNNLIAAELRIEDSERPFRIVGTDQRLGVLGTLVIPRGIVHFRDADFSIRRGVVSFDDAESIDPSFDVHATTEVRRAGSVLAGPAWRIGLHAHGTSDSFQLDTSSQPELSQEDIVLLLTVGLTRAEAEQLQAGDIGGTAAIEALTAVTGIDREVQRAVQVIDSFAITSRYSGRTGRTEPLITIGKRITDDVRLTGSTGITDSQQVRAGVEWQLDDETSLQMLYDNQSTNTSSGVGNIGADLRWRLEFE